MEKFKGGEYFCKPLYVMIEPQVIIFMFITKDWVMENGCLYNSTDCIRQSTQLFICPVRQVDFSSTTCPGQVDKLNVGVLSEPSETFINYFLNYLLLC